MNQAEKKARQAYKKNQNLFDTNPNLTSLELCKMAQQQDVFYKIYNNRIDKNMRGKHE